MTNAYWKQCKQWLGDNRLALLFILVLLLVTPMRGLWAPDEPDFAQCIREMRENGSWLLPYLNGEPYNEKPILFYWLMKGFAIAGDKLTSGLGFTNGISAWALRLPSVLSAGLFVWVFRKWAVRFANRITAELSTLVLITTPIWMWQAQFIQIDMLFAALVAWSWLAWLSGYLLSRGEVQSNSPREARTWFYVAYIALSLSFLAKGPLALVLSVFVLVAFLAWEKDWKILTQMHLVPALVIFLVLILPWYIAAGIKGGADYAYNMIIHQNINRALNAWDHIQPWWRYGEYVAGDLFPWTLLLPSMAIFHFKNRARLCSIHRFFIVAALVPVLLLSFSLSKQGKYALMIYPFVALLMGEMLGALVNEMEPSRWARRLGGLFAGLLGALGLASIAVVFLNFGGAKLQATIAPYLRPAGLISLLLVFSAGIFAKEAILGRCRNFARDVGITVGLIFLVSGTWGFRLLEPHKGYWHWTTEVKPIITGHRVYYWQVIRSGAMVYTDNLTMPEIHTTAQLEALPTGALLVATDRNWFSDIEGLSDAHREMFHTLVKTPIGAISFLLMEKRAVEDAVNRES
jgi:4-amino-4-deoxy-L-arabinose transferase-like glycosyltransferase